MIRVRADQARSTSTVTDGSNKEMCSETEEQIINAEFSTVFFV